MKLSLITFFLFISIFHQEGYLQQKISNAKIDALKNQILEEIKKCKGTFAVAFRDVDNNSNEIIINGEVIFHAASTMKTPVMVEVFKQYYEGKFSIDDSIIVKNQFTSIVDSSLYSLNVNDDGDDKIYSQIGKKRKIYDLVYDMITVSSNLATNLLIELVGASNITKTMRYYDLKNINVIRGVEDSKAFNLGLNNTVNASDLMKLYELIAQKKLINEKACEEMIKILSEQKFNDKIPRYLPYNVKVAHKTGSISGVEHDSGIVFLPDGRKYVLVILSRGLENSDKGKETIGKISKLIYDFMIG